MTRLDGAHLPSEHGFDPEGDRRLLVRLGLDLHDGPLQEAAALGTELHFFRDQLTDAFGGQTPAVQRVDELIGRVGDLAEHLRELAVAASSSSSPARPRRRTPPLEAPLSVALAEAVELHADSCTIDLLLEPASSDVDGALLTDSQRIAVFRIVQGALANVAQHSGAFLATVAVRVRLDGVELEVTDDGCGFDVEARERASESAGHLGLAGMRRRVRFLGGRLEIVSRPGGPTCLRAFLPRWRPQ